MESDSAHLVIGGQHCSCEEPQGQALGRTSRLGQDSMGMPQYCVFPAPPAYNNMCINHSRVSFELTK